MKPASLGIPSRDLGLSAVRPFGEALLTRLETYEQRIAELEERLYGRKRTIRPAMLAERVLLDRLDSRTGDAVTLERQRVRDRAFDELYFKIELAAGVVNYFGAVTEVDVNNTIAMRMPNGASTFARRMVRGRDLWPKTRLRFEAWYTSPVGSTATFSLLGVLWAHDAGGAAAGAGISVAWTAPGPAVANTPMKTTAVVTAPVNAAPREVVRLAFGRTDPDNNANDLDVYLAVATFEEVA